MQRRVIAELLDEDLGSAAEIAASLEDLRHINQWFGGVRTTVALLKRIAAECNCTQLSLLEIGAGQGAVPLAAQKSLAGREISLDVTLLDRAPTHMPHNGVPSIAADAMHLPFGDNAFDVVSCSLFAHHFDPEPLQRMLEEALRVSRRAVLINDLIRSRLHLLLVYLGLPLFRSRITRHDAPASVRAAYTLKEMKSLVSSAPARRVEVGGYFLFRMGVILWK
jgi:ubiquinone/menaquinone biosynthesis C-methylase UbiE